jgi:hypothetical protein
MQKLMRLHETSPVSLKPALIEYIWSRDDIPKHERLNFLADVVRGDPSLSAVAADGRYLSQALEAKLKALAIDSLLQKWEEWEAENLSGEAVR